jgi:hypothetical protein
MEMEMKVVNLIKLVGVQIIQMGINTPNVVEQ